MPSPKFPVANDALLARQEALRQVVEDGLKARKSHATASEISRLAKTLERLEPAARNVPSAEIEEFSASGVAAFDAALLAAA